MTGGGQLKRQGDIRLKGRGVFPAEHGWLEAVLNFLLNFGVAVVWLGRWTIRLAARFLQRWER